MLEGLTADRLTPLSIWKSLDGDTRKLAAESMYRSHETRAEADFAICQAIRFRDSAVRKLPTARRVGYLLRTVPINEHLAGSLLLALHLQSRTEVLTRFLDELEIPHEDGMIDQEHELERPEDAKLDAAVEALLADHEPDHVRLYLASLVSMDRHTWERCIDHLKLDDAAPGADAAESAE